MKRVVTDSTEVSQRELRAAAPNFRRRIAYARPRSVCFTSTRAFGGVVPGGWRPHQWGQQDATLEGASGWVMPSTSGRAAAHRAEVGRVLADLATALGRTSLEGAA